MFNRRGLFVRLAGAVASLVGAQLPGVKDYGPVFDLKGIPLPIVHKDFYMVNGHTVRLVDAYPDEYWKGMVPGVYCETD